MKSDKTKIKLVYHEDRRSKVPVLNINIKTFNNEHSENIKKYINLERNGTKEIEVDLREFFVE